MPENCTADGCPMVQRIEALERESQHNKEAHQKFYDSITNVALLDERMKQIKEDTEEIKVGTQGLKKDVEELKMKPGKRWDGIVDKLLWAVVGAVVTFLLAKGGL